MRQRAFKILILSLSLIAFQVESVKASPTKSPTGKQKIVNSSKSAKDAIEALRKKIPEAKTISEQNGFSIQDKSGEYFTLTRLAAASLTVPDDTLPDLRTLMNCLEDDDQKIRFIAAQALERKLKVHPNGLSMGEIDGTDVKRHKQLIERFQTKIAETFK